MSPEAVHSLAQEQVIKAPNGDLEILLTRPDGTYQMDWEHSYGNEVFNPAPEKFSDFVHGRTVLRMGRHKLLFGITLNGVCPADCLDCPYARSVLAKNKATPITPLELQSALRRAYQIGIQERILELGEGFAAGALLAGDPGYSRHIPELIALVSQFPGCEACRWSTIAPKTEKNVLEAFLLGAQMAKSLNPSHIPSFQVSLHSTDHAQRVTHTGVDRLLSMTEIFSASQRIKEVTGRRLSLSFVLHEGSVIDPGILRANFSPDFNLISLRPIYSSTARPMDSERLIALYSKLRTDGWDVVYMPPNQSSGIGTAPIELHNLRG